MQYLENFANTIPDIYTAVTLLKLLITLSEKAESKDLSKKLGKKFCYMFHIFQVLLLQRTVISS